MKLIQSLACLSILAFSISATAEEIVIENTSSSDAKLYSNTGSGWNYEGTVRSGGRGQSFQTTVGESWGFADPYLSRVDIIKTTTVRSWGNNSLILTERDFNQPGAPQPLQRNVSITNYSSETVTVYTNQGSGWRLEGTVRAGSNASYPVRNGERWGIDDPGMAGLNLVKEITVKSYDPFPGMTVNDEDLGLTQAILPPPGAPRSKILTADNRSRDDLNLYVDSGGGYRYISKVRSGREETFEAVQGDAWAFDDPHEPGINPIRRVVINAWGSNVLSVSDSDFHGGGGGILPIFPKPKPEPLAKVSITFDNKSIHKGQIYLKNGLFSKNLLGTVGSWGQKTYSLTPGDTIVISKPGSIKTIIYRVPSSSQTYSFKPRS
ncbi:hypothetical protein VSU19_18750 [Verrucomicrobiales bacterium BCK34]|nr:hypothetical protein [Verrucomicrobiales bacterium BCK34]